MPMMPAGVCWGAPWFAGARQETRAKNREALYAISAALEKAAKQQQRRQQGKPEGRAASKPAPKQPAAAAEQQQQQPDKGENKKKKKKRSAEEAGVATPGPATLSTQQGAGRAAWPEYTAVLRISSWFWN